MKSKKKKKKASKRQAIRKKLPIALAGFTVLVVVLASLFIFLKTSRSQSAQAVELFSVPISSESPIASQLPASTPNPVESIAQDQTYAPKPNDFCLNVPVIFYHHIEPIAQAKSEGHAGLTVDANVFDSQMAYLAQKGYSAITAEDLARAIISGSQLSAKSIVITIDDGYSDFYYYGYPILKKYGFKTSLMIPTGLVNNSGYLSWSQLKEMVASGSVFAYNHTWSHASLSGLSSEKIQFEVNTAKKQLSENLGIDADIFTYPYGDYDSTVENVLRQDGFVAAYSTVGGFSQCRSNIMNLHRTRIGNQHLSTFGL